MDQAVAVKRAALITDLPTECLKRILQRLSLTNIFRVMSVSREWHVAAKAVVRDWPVLRIIERQEMDNNSVKIGGGHGPSPQMLSSLMQMHNLRAFLFQIFLGKENQWDKLILQNSASLQRLEYHTFMVSLRLSFSFAVIKKNVVKVDAILYESRFCCP